MMDIMLPPKERTSLCDYCRRPVETDSQGRCVNCGAQHNEAHAALVRVLNDAVDQTEKRSDYWRAMIGATSGFALASYLFRSSW